MGDIARAEQHDVGAGLVPAVAVGGIDHALGATFVDQEFERLLTLGQPARHAAFGGQLLHGLLQAARDAEQAAHHEHQEGADPVLQGEREDGLARVLVHHVERQHHDLPAIVPYRPLQHLVRRIIRRGFGDTEVADLALGLLVQQRRHELLHGVVVGCGRHAVELEQIDMIGTQGAQRAVQARDHVLCRQRRAVPSDLRLGRDHDAITRHLP